MLTVAVVAVACLFVVVVVADASDVADIAVPVTIVAVQISGTTKSILDMLLLNL